MLYRIFGILFLILAIVGMILPLMPGTVFLILSAWCFSKSSERWHQWLLNHRIFGPILQNWEKNRCMSKNIKIVAIGSMVLVGGFSVLMAIDLLWLKVLGITFISIGVYVVLSIKTCPAILKN